MTAELVDGQWRSVRGVMRWVPGVAPARPAEVADLRARMRPALSRKIDVHPFIACPTCGARADERCRSKAGNATANHDARLISVRCPCGEPVQPRKQYCEPCRARSRKQTYRLRESRRPTSERRAG